MVGDVSTFEFGLGTPRTKAWAGTCVRSKFTFASVLEMETQVTAQYVGFQIRGKRRNGGNLR